MPTFRTQRPRGIADSVRMMLSGSPELSAADRIGLDRAAADVERNNSLAEKARQEIEEMRKQSRFRDDPEERIGYGATTSGLTVPQARRLQAFIAGEEGAIRPEDVSPEAERAYRAAIGSLSANRFATGRTNAQQLTAGGGNILVDAVRGAMAAPGTSLDRQNQLGHSIGIRSREPFRISREGVILNEETGQANEGTDLARMVRDNIGAQATERHAAAGLSGERATDLRQTRQSRIDLNTSRATSSREGRPAPKRTPAQEARDKAYADRQRAAAEQAERENERAAQSDARRTFRSDPDMKGKTLGKWVRGQGFEVLEGGKVIGYYD